MTGSESPVMTDAQQIMQTQAAHGDVLIRLVDAVNQLGEQQQWLVDNVKDIFEFFHSPALMGMLGGMAGGMPDLNTVIPGEVEKDHA